MDKIYKQMKQFKKDKTFKQDLQIQEFQHKSKIIRVSFKLNQ